MKHQFIQNMQEIARQLIEKYPSIYNNQRLYYNIWKDKKGVHYYKKERNFNAHKCLVGHLIHIHNEMTKKEQSLPMNDVVSLLMVRSYQVYLKFGFFKPSFFTRMKNFFIRKIWAFHVKKVKWKMSLRKIKNIFFPDDTKYIDLGNGDL